MSPANLTCARAPGTRDSWAPFNAGRLVTELVWSAPLPRAAALLGAQSPGGARFGR